MNDNPQELNSSQNPDEQGNTQELSQSNDVVPVKPEDDLDAQCWGVLIPYTPEIERIRFLKTTLKITVGRSKSTVALPWMCISAQHAVITWNGKEGDESEVTIEDCSTNGTYFNASQIGKGNKRVLSDGTEISFGPARRPGRENMPEYRYTYRDLVSEQRDLYKKYDLSVELGQGAYARVYKALQKRTSKWVAVKVIHQTMRLNLTPADEAGAIREISIMRTLRHPNICAFLDYFDNENKSLDIVLEYMDGGDLGTFIFKHGYGLGDWLSCHITYQICNAVVYIHSLDITHRDLKPENILLTLHKPPIVKIADFGLAKVVDEKTALRTMCGTPIFMAPEIVNRLSTDPPYTNLVDSWSLGGIVFSMFTAHTPFPKVATLELKAMMTNRNIQWIHLDRSEGISDNGRDFVQKLLVFEPDLRMSLVSAEEHPWL
ncbi:kinase-like domain-containing protein, partial [Mycena capillaripes]